MSSTLVQFVNLSEVKIFIPRRHFVPKGGYRNAFCPSVRTGSDLRDGSWDRYETLGYLGVPIGDDAHHFWFLKKSKMAARRWKKSKKWPFLPILIHFMSYLYQNCFNRSEIDIKGGIQFKVNIWIICREVRFKMADWRPFWIAENEGWHQTGPTDL